MSRDEADFKVKQGPECWELGTALEIGNEDQWWTPAPVPKPRLASKGRTQTWGTRLLVYLFPNYVLLDEIRSQEILPCLLRVWTNAFHFSIRNAVGPLVSRKM